MDLYCLTGGGAVSPRQQKPEGSKPGKPEAQVGKEGKQAKKEGAQQKKEGNQLKKEGNQPKKEAGQASAGDGAQMSKAELKRMRREKQVCTLPAKLKLGEHCMRLVSNFIWSAFTEILRSSDKFEI